MIAQRFIFRNKTGLNLVGYYSYTSGVAEVGRFFARFTKKAGIPFLIYDLEALGYKKLDAISLKAYQPHFARETVYHKNIFFVNADQILYLCETFPQLFLGRYNAAVFFWEFNDYFTFPEAFKALNEVIAFTDFIATAVRKAAPDGIPVTKLPFPFAQNWEITKPPWQIREQLGIAENDFVFIFNFDFYSVYQRKNPEAILKAFELTFTSSDHVWLILKTIHGETGVANYSDFLDAVKHMQLKDKLIVINKNLERNELMNMINASDCYISLHRSEGLGLGMLEAMSMAKPVIGTDFGGNTDFMRPDNSLPVRYTLVPVEEGAGPYKAGWMWAEADVEQAAAYMKQLYMDRAFATGLGQKARQSVMEQYSYQIFQKSMDKWLHR